MDRILEFYLINNLGNIGLLLVVIYIIVVKIEYCFYKY